jgi:hypothetical protein
MGETFILIINQELYHRDALPVMLLNPNQMRSHGLIVNDAPIHLAPDPDTAMHSIYIPQYDWWIPKQLNGVASCLPVWYPTLKEMKTCTWIELTGEDDLEPKKGHEHIAEENQNHSYEAPEPGTKDKCNENQYHTTFVFITRADE